MSNLAPARKACRGFLLKLLEFWGYVILGGMQLLATVLPYVEAILAIALIGLILLQQGDGSLGAAFGGGDSLGAVRVKRGVELHMFVLTIIVAILFAGSALISLFV